MSLAHLHQFEVSELLSSTDGWSDVVTRIEVAIGNWYDAVHGTPLSTGENLTVSPFPLVGADDVCRAGSVSYRRCFGHHY